VPLEDWFSSVAQLPPKPLQVTASISLGAGHLTDSLPLMSALF
jgi:hypothetical protein